MVAFYGYATYLMSPINRMTFAVTKAMQAHVAAANITRLLRLEPDIGPGPDCRTGPMPGSPARLADPDSGLVVPARGLTAVVCSAGDAIALSDRLGRYVRFRPRPMTASRWRRCRWPGFASGSWSPPLTRTCSPGRCDVSSIRPAGWTGSDDDELLWAAVDAAAARDIIEALPDQFDTSVAAGGREFSGGQQQRLRLARALMADPEVLILIDPTSAVDAHTESLMAAGIARLRQRPRHRRVHHQHPAAEPGRSGGPGHRRHGSGRGEP